MEIGVCKQCGKTTFIQNKTKCLCSECVYMNNHNGKTKLQVAIERQKQKKIKAKSTGERQVFLRIWSERFHVCSNCGRLLGDTPRSYMFSHRIAKGVNEKERLNPNNIDLLCLDCHFARDMQSREVFEKRKKGILK